MDIKYLIWVFISRLPYFLIVTLVISAAAVIVARSLPPAYVSQMRLVVDAPQIPTELAKPTVATSAVEQLQIIEQRLLTREVLLDIARRLDVLENIGEMSPDAIVQSMRSRTKIRRSSGRNQATLMTISFEAQSAATAAGVLNEYLTLIQQLDVEIRRGRASQTLDFFQQEVVRLSSELAKKRAAILEFKLKNSDALPESLDFRLSQQTLLQERLAQLTRDISNLEQQRNRLMTTFESTGQVAGATSQARSTEQVRLEQMRAELAQDLAIFSETNPRIKTLQAKIKNLENIVASQPVPRKPDAESTGNPLLDLQLAELETRMEVLTEQRSSTEEQLQKILQTINATPASSIKLDELELDHENIQTQYTTAVARLASASTGERIEFLSRGQKISIIEPPAIPNSPSKPNRTMIAGGGTFLGILAGLGLVVLLEFLDKSVRRAEDLVTKLNITPLTTIPYIRTRWQKFRQRSLKLFMILMILIGIPALVYAVHTFYQPLDLISERIMDKFGLR